MWLWWCGVALNSVAVVPITVVVAADVDEAVLVVDDDALVVADALAVVVGKSDRLDD